MAVTDETIPVSKRARRRHRKVVRRLVWHLNHNHDSEAFLSLAGRAGYTVDTANAGAGRREYRLSSGGAIVAIVQYFSLPLDRREAFAYLFEPEAVTPWWSQAWWRISHPLTPLAEPSWPRRREAVDA